MIIIILIKLLKSITPVRVQERSTMNIMKKYLLYVIIPFVQRKMSMSSQRSIKRKLFFYYID